MQIKWLTFWLILIVSFLTFGTMLSFGVAGYVYNWQVGKIEKTGMIILQSTPNRAQVKINGKDESEQTPLKLSYLKKGQYDLEVSLDKYRPWQKTVSVSPELATIEKAVLFLYAPVKTDLEKNPGTIGARDEKLKIDNGEIWFDNHLVSRISQQIDDAQISSDRDYIVYRIGKELRSIMLDGSNDNLIYQFNSSEVKFNFKNEETLVVQEDNRFYSLRLI